MESFLEKFAIAAFLPGAILFFLTIHVLHFSELEGGRFNGWYQFWPFYDEMKNKYPEISRLGRGLTYLCCVLTFPWVIVKLLGFCG